MTDLSAIEVELLYAIKNDQGRTLTYYGDELRKHHSQLTRALERLKRAGYVRATENNRLYISDEFQQRQQAAAVQNPEPVPEVVQETKTEPEPVVESAPVVEVPETAPVLKIKEGQFVMKVTPEMIAELMADNVPRTAADIARYYGHAKGTSLINPLRKLVTDGLLNKNLTVYSLPVNTIETVVEAVAEITQEIAEPADAEEPDSDDELAARLIQVLEKDVPAALVEYHNETLAEDHTAAKAHAEKLRGNLPTLFSGELQNHILKKRNAFTAGEVMLDFAESHYIDKDRFDEIFEDVVNSGNLMCWDGVEFIDPTLEYVPGSQYIVLRKTDPADAIAIMDEYCENIRAPYKLFDIVETTHIHHADVLRYLVDFDYDVSNPNSIVKGPHTSNVQYAQKTAVSAGPRAGQTAPVKTFPVKTGYQAKEYKPFKAKSDRDVPLISYAMVKDLKPNDITEFLDGGVKVDVFIRKFNLHPDDRKEILHVLTITDLAEVTSVEDEEWLFPKGCADTAESAEDVEAERSIDSTEVLMQAADAALEEVAENATASIDTLRDAILESTLTPSTVFMSRELADELGVPVTECICEHRTFGDELHEDACPVAELENDLLDKPVEGNKGPTGPTNFFCKSKPDAQWLLTLKMLEERLRFEHQGTTADQLHEIRKYLEP
jgi:hypothetical protein